MLKNFVYKSKPMIYNKYMIPLSWPISFAIIELHSICFSGELRINKKIMHKILVFMKLAGNEGLDEPAHTHITSEPSLLAYTKYGCR